MSGSSIRRHMFHRNLDRLLQDSPLHPVQEEARDGGTLEGKTDPGGEEETLNLRTELSMEAEGNAPIYRPKPEPRDTRKDHGCTVRPVSDYENYSPIYADPWSPTTPVVEPAQSLKGAVNEEGEKSHYKKKSKPGIQPLIFQYPDNNNNNDDIDVTLNPLYSSGPLHSSTPHWSGGSQRPKQPLWTAGGQCRPGGDREEVIALPMSPALYLTQHPNTPGGPGDEDFKDPLCHSLIEHSMFSHPECNMCRICHEDGGREKLVSPCHCAGTMGMLHVTCLERWLGSSNTTKCEICQFQFKVLKKRHPLKWYMREPSLNVDRRAMIKEISLMVSVTLLVILISILCLSFAGKLLEEKKDAPSIVLLVVAVGAVIAYCVWIGVMSRRIHHRFSQWNESHHTVQIKQSDQPETRNRKPSRFSNRLTLTKKLKSIRETNIAPQNLQSSTYISYSLESYKAAMFNPITPADPLLEDPHDLTMLDVDSPSVMSLDDDDAMQTMICYYQPPESGHTSMLYSETGRLLRETGV